MSKNTVTMAGLEKKIVMLEHLLEEKESALQSSEDQNFNLLSEFQEAGVHLRIYQKNTHDIRVKHEEFVDKIIKLESQSEIFLWKAQTNILRRLVNGVGSQIRNALMKLRIGGLVQANPGHKFLEKKNLSDMTQPTIAAQNYRGAVGLLAILQANLVFSQRVAYDQLLKFATGHKNTNTASLTSKKSSLTKMIACNL
jgi:hypothetical protein